MKTHASPKSIVLNIIFTVLKALGIILVLTILAFAIAKTVADKKEKATGEMQYTFGYQDCYQYEKGLEDQGIKLGAWTIVRNDDKLLIEIQPGDIVMYAVPADNKNGYEKRLAKVLSKKGSEYNTTAGWMTKDQIKGKVVYVANWLSVFYNPEIPAIDE